jgi:hypothetical protein
MKTKKVTITMTEEWQEFARQFSIEILGQENISGLFIYFLNEYKKKKDKEQKKNLINLNSFIEHNG